MTTRGPRTHETRGKRQARALVRQAAHALGMTLDQYAAVNGRGGIRAKEILDDLGVPHAPEPHNPGYVHAESGGRDLNYLLFSGGGEWALPKEAKPECMERPGLFEESNKGGNHREVEIAEAKSICARCPWRAECADYALRHDVSGIWGGIKFVHGRRARDCGERIVG